jgi:hypothetical protein
MNLPNYFLADLPPEATLSPALIGEACASLKKNRELYLVPRSTAAIVRVLAEVARSWQQPDNPFRQLAQARSPAETGFPPATLRRGLDAFFAQITGENLQRLIEQDLGHAQRLDTLCASPGEEGEQRAALARGPELIAHITAGNLPVSALTSLILGLLTRSAQFVKCARDTSFLPRLFAHSIYDIDPKLASCLEIAAWPGGAAELEAALFAEADCVTATGRDETLAEIRRRLPARARFVGYGHRVSFAYVAAEALAGARTAQQLAALAAADVAAWNQLGCLSPHVIYVEHGGVIAPDQFAEMLARELEKIEPHEPRGEVHLEVAATIAARRDFFRVRASASEESRVWQSHESSAWTVIYDAEPLFQFSCLHRFIHVKAVAHLTEALHGADAVRGQVSTVGLAAPEAKAHQLATALAAWGVTRLCPLGRMQCPPLGWRHDGRPALADLVTWTDWEL